MFYQVIAPFLLPLFLAATLVILCRPYYLWLVPRVWNRTDLAAGLMTALVMLLLVGPLVIGTFVGAVELTKLSQDQLQDWDWSRGLDQFSTRFIEPATSKLQEWFPGIAMDEQIKKLKAELPQSGAAIAQLLAGKTFLLASSTAGTVLSLMVSGGMFLVAFYYFLADGPAMLQATEALIPMPLEHLKRLQDRFAKVVRAVVLATFSAAFAQGVATAIALQFVGMGHFFIFLIAATISALVPLAGTWMVWGPCAALLAFQGHYASAIGLALFGIIVVGLLDNMIRTYVLNSDAQLHPLLAFVSVLGALQVMGLWGIFFGPIIASVLYALVQIFKSELDSLQRETAPPERVPAVIVPAAPTVELAPPAVAKLNHKEEPRTK